METAGQSSRRQEKEDQGWDLEQQPGTSLPDNQKQSNSTPYGGRNHNPPAKSQTKQGQSGVEEQAGKGQAQHPWQGPDPPGSQPQQDVSGNAYNYRQTSEYQHPQSQKGTG